VHYLLGERRGKTSVSSDRTAIASITVFFFNEVRMKETNTRYFALASTAIIGAAIFALSLLAFFNAFRLPADKWGLVKDAFASVVPTVLLPMFNTLVTAALTYIFGKQLVPALSERIRAKASEQRRTQ
jgi:fructose-specific phosphotransferase system IIC component